MTDSGMHVYLSRLILDSRSRQVWCELAKPYEMHRTLMRAFPELSDDQNDARSRFDVLFRAEMSPHDNSCVVYVQSTTEPDWSYLDNLNGYLAQSSHHDNPACKNITSAFRGLKGGQLLSFCLRANPVKRIAKPEPGHEDLKGKRIGLLKEEDQIDWLTRKGQQREPGQTGGFEIHTRTLLGEDQSAPSLTVHPEGRQFGHKKIEGNSHKMTHLGVRYDGILKITDPDAFRQTLIRGIGPGKAFGFGLLSIAPVR